MDDWMSAWFREWMGWVSECMKEWMNERKEGVTDRVNEWNGNDQRNEWMKLQWMKLMNEGTNAWMNEWMNKGNEGNEWINDVDKWVK